MISIFLLLVATAVAQLNGDVSAWNSVTSTFQGTGSTIVYYGLNTQSNSGTQTTTLGPNATTAGSTQGTAVGNYATATGTQASAFGFNARALQANGLAMGSGALASFQSSVVLGFNAKDGTGGAASVVIGPSASGQQFSTTVGELANCGATADVCMGYMASTSTTGIYGVAIGTFAQAFGTYATAVGVQTIANANSCSVFGIEATCSTTGTYGVAVGREANAAAPFATCVGTYSAVLANNGVCMGNNCLVNVPNGIAIGPGANSQIAGSIALGPAASALDASHAFALVINTASVVAQGLGITLNGVAQQIPLYPAVQLTNTLTTGTTTLTASSAPKQWFFATQTVVLPVVTTLQQGAEYRIVNLSTGNVVVHTSGGVTKITLLKNTAADLVCINTSGGTGTASWTAVGPFPAA
jgi:sarcosine oxidase gamma subunit